MAPSRRRGAGKAAAAVASRRKWKVGDLVLAKLKGFPAWPATVSEPEKWGYQTDVRKVLVYFFGTQQIAFCNPVDVEAFNEEKKQSLLTKRQGKGADFVRAVQEIVDIYEKSKEQDQVDELNLGHEVPLASGNSAASSAHNKLKDWTETSESTPSGRSDHPVPLDVTQDVAQTGFMHEKEAFSEQLTDNVMVPDKPIIATYSSRRRSGGLRARKNIVEKKVSSVERSRSPCWLESPRFQNSMMPSNDPKKSAGHVSYSIIWDKSLQRSRRLMKSPEKSERDDEDSSGFVSNCSIEDNGSEIVMVDSDSFSLNNGNSVDSGCRPEQSETFVKCLEGDMQLSKGLDFQIQAVVIRKKRIRNRKRVSNGDAEPTVGLESEGDLEVALSNSCQNSHSVCENIKEMSNQEDGDMHLPLVKRARVRMGKSSILDEEHNNFSQAEKRNSNETVVSLIEEHSCFLQAGGRTSHEALVDRLELVGPSANPTDSGSAPEDSLVMKGSIRNTSPLKVSSQIRGNGLRLLCSKVNQSFGSSADDEAALPPSKRLHRALEAMSANAAEEEAQAGAETSTMKTSINGCSLSLGRSFQVEISSEESNNSANQKANNPGNRVSTFCSYSNTISKESGNSLLEAEISDQPRECTGEEEPQGDEARDLDESKDHAGLCHATGISCTDVQGHSFAHFIPGVNERLINQLSNHELLDKDEGISENIKAIDLVAKNLDNELGAEKQCGLTPSVDEPDKVASQNGTSGDLCSTENNGCKNTKSFRSQIGDNCQISGGFALGNDVKFDERQNKISHISFLDNIVVDKHVVDILPNPCRADGAESPARMSPSSTSICHASTSESANIIRSTCCSSPNVCSNKQNAVHSSDADEEKFDSAVPQRPKSINRGSNDAEAFAVLSSFEGILGSLTRTKDSIGRATRLAIDCAKHGLSAKVVEILSRTLENESSLHRRVDFFFLVDSIAQCSRTLKGDGGVFPSVIQQVLPRLLLAAAPPGAYSNENRRQCLKVLRLWLERRILPESVIHHHIRELDSLGYSSSAGPYSRRSARTERALDDPVRDMEGMLVDEYGSNSSFQLPGFCMPCICKDEDDESDSDGGSFEAVTPEHKSEIPNEREALAMEKHIHILEDVDGELEMEDLAPSCEAEMSSTSGASGVNTAQNMLGQFERHFPTPIPLPHNIAPSSPPFPSSSPPLPPPPPPTDPPSGIMLDPYANGVASNGYSNSQNMQDDLMQSVAPRMNPSMSSSVRFYAPESSNNRRICDSNSCCCSYPVHQVNDIQHNHGPSYHRDPYPPRPERLPSSDQFSYFQASQHMKSRRETQYTSYSHRFSSSHNFRGGKNYYRRERMRPASDCCENWRFYAPPFHGPRNSYKSKGSYAPASYGGPLREPNRLRRQDWECHSRGMNHRNFMPFRTSSGGAISVASRASSIWQSR